MQPAVALLLCSKLAGGILDLKDSRCSTIVDVGTSSRYGGCSAALHVLLVGIATRQLLLGHVLRFSYTVVNQKPKAASCQLGPKVAKQQLEYINEPNYHAVIREQLVAGTTANVSPSTALCDGSDPRDCWRAASRDVCTDRHWSLHISVLLCT